MYHHIAPISVSIINSAFSGCTGRSAHMIQLALLIKVAKEYALTSSDMNANCSCRNENIEWKVSSLKENIIHFSALIVACLCPQPAQLVIGLFKLR